MANEASDYAPVAPITRFGRSPERTLRVHRYESQSTAAERASTPPRALASCRSGRERLRRQSCGLTARMKQIRRLNGWPQCCGRPRRCAGRGLREQARRARSMHLREAPTSGSKARRGAGDAWSCSICCSGRANGSKRVRRYDDARRSAGSPHRTVPWSIVRNPPCADSGLAPRRRVSVCRGARASPVVVATPSLPT